MRGDAGDKSSTGDLGVISLRDYKAIPSLDNIPFATWLFSWGPTGDWLFGRAGDDILIGENGTLQLFGDGDDVIEDFTAGFVRLHPVASQLGTEGQSIAQVLESAVVRDRNVVLLFAGKHSLTLNSVTDVQALLDDLTLI